MCAYFKSFIITALLVLIILNVSQHSVLHLLWLWGQQYKSITFFMHLRFSSPHLKMPIFITHILSLRNSLQLDQNAPLILFFQLFPWHAFHMAKTFHLGSLPYKSFLLTFAHATQAALNLAPITQDYPLEHLTLSLPLHPYFSCSLLCFFSLL